MKIFLLFLFIFSLINSKEEKDIFEANKNLRFCGADLMHHEINQYISKAKQLKINKSNRPRKLETINYRPIRIFVETTYLEYQAEQNIPLKYKIPTIKAALDKAVKGLQGFLEVEDLGNTNIFGHLDMRAIFTNNYIFKWSPIFDIDNNIQSDFLLIVRFDDYQQFPQGVIASGAAVEPDPYTYRPIIGILTVTTDLSMYSPGRITEYFSEVFLHEITHTLGFLSSLFQFYQNGNIPITEKHIIRGISRTLVVSPKVVEIAKKYFNCSNIIGVELEDQGGEGSENSHWNQRILLGDYMGAVIYHEEMIVSEFTLALFEDSGWYNVKYYTGGLMKFGKNKGCAFLEKNCLDPVTHKTEFDNEFFNYEDKMSPSCSAGRLTRTYAMINESDTILDKNYSSNFIYENGKYYSGVIYTADYCLIHSQHPNELFSYFSGNCNLGSGAYGSNIYYYNYDKNAYERLHSNHEFSDLLGEQYSNSSFCFMSKLVPAGKYKMYGSIFHPMCYQVNCSSSFLTIKILDDYVVCPRTGGNVKLKGFDGKIHCPDYNLICSGTVLCNDMFDCIEKKSMVKEESYYYDYIPITTQNYEKLSELDTLIAYELSDDGVCPLYCSQCSKNKKCKNCQDGYNLVGVNQNDNNPIFCDNKTNLNGYYKAEDNVYYLCSEECENCVDKKDKCTSCKENYFLVENSNKCYNQTNCPKGYYFNKKKKVFSACHKNCATCSIGPDSDSKMNCDTCKVGFKYDKNIKNCKEETSNILLWIFMPLIIIALIVGIVVVYIIIRRKRNPDVYNNIEKL